jgi:hypothetical protein
MKYKYFLIFVIAIVIISVLGAVLFGRTELNRAKAYLLPPTALGMEEVAPRVFVNKNMPLTQREEILRIVIEAKRKIIDFYGDSMSDPQILACSTEECFTSLGGVKARALDLSKSKIILSSRGLTSPILTHEWSHAEMRVRMNARMDGVFGISSMPTWFDEGLAVVVSEEPTHSEKVWEQIIATKMTTPRIEDLVSLKGWQKAAKEFGDVDCSSGIPGKMCVVYATAGHEVRQWYQRVGKSGLMKLIEKVKSGEDFDETYRTIGQNNE